MVKLYVIIIVFIIRLASIYCVMLVPERANITEVNPRYATFAKLYVSRLSRKSPYFINVEGHITQSWTNNVTGHYYFYEYLHNEYRRSFPEIHIKYCDGIQKDAYLGKMFANAGISCPLPAGTYRLLNMTMPLQNFPYKLPFSKFRVVIELTQTDTKDVLFKGYLNGFFKGVI